jgi:hypothetical protein
MPLKKTRVPARARNAEQNLLDLLTVRSGRRARPLTDEERRLLVMMLTIKRDPLALDIERLVPKGSFLARVRRHFVETDISFALPIFQTIMIAASWLTQNGAKLEIAGVGEIQPTLWTIALAESGSAKTLAASRMTAILGDGNGTAPVRMLPSPGSDAQWIVDLAHDNGAFWFQDEVGKFFSNVLKNKLFSRIKPWMLSAYSHEPIGNRLKHDAEKLEIARPAFTFFGLSVLSTWREDVDAVSMLDGFCQRPNYVVATARQDTDIFDHFIYFEGTKVAAAEADLRELWNALCAQPGAAGTYTLQPDVLPYLRRWWSGLRATWGDAGVPGSFVRRIGYSVLRYLVVLHFLLGKSRYPVDVETAHLATRFAEFHLESTREMLQAYDRTSVDRMRKIVAARSAIRAEGKPVTPRNIQRRLGKARRAGLTAELLNTILENLDRVDLGEPFPETFDGRQAKVAAIAARLETLEGRLLHNEQKRNERRLRHLRRAYLSGGNGAAGAVTADDSTLCTSPAPAAGKIPAMAKADDPAGAAGEAWVDQTFGFGAVENSQRQSARVIPLRLR